MVKPCPLLSGGLASPIETLDDFLRDVVKEDNDFEEIGLGGLGPSPGRLAGVSGGGSTTVLTFCLFAGEKYTSSPTTAPVSLPHSFILATSLVYLYLLVFDVNITLSSCFNLIFQLFGLAKARLKLSQSDH